MFRQHQGTWSQSFITNRTRLQANAAGYDLCYNVPIEADIDGGIISATTNADDAGAIVSVSAFAGLHSILLQGK